MNRQRWFDVANEETDPAGGWPSVSAWIKQVARRRPLDVGMAASQHGKVDLLAADLPLAVQLRREAARLGSKIRLVTGMDKEDIWGLCAIVPYYGDFRLLPWFLDNYRRLGVGHFVFLDLTETNELPEFLGAVSDCSVFSPVEKLEPNDMVHALNYLRHHYARGRWCLSVGPQDVIYFSVKDLTNLCDLIDLVESRFSGDIVGLVIDVFGERVVREMGVLKKKCFPDVRHSVRRSPCLGGQAGDDYVAVFGRMFLDDVYGDEPRFEGRPAARPSMKLMRHRSYTESTEALGPFGESTPHLRGRAVTTACLIRLDGQIC